MPISNYLVSYKKQWTIRQGSFIIFRMGRRKTYDRQNVIEKATHLFHRQGFNSTTTEDIIDAVGINKFSLYSEFPTNKDLFVDCLKYYYSFALTENFGLIEQPSANLNDIITLFEELPHRARQAGGKGCLLCNTAIEFSDQEEHLNPLLRKYFNRIQSAFKNSLCNAVKEKNISSKTDIVELASYLTTTVLGLMVSTRAKLPAANIKNTCALTVNYLRLIALKID
jgi:TetR/AcrR family transcriptional regulator, transcriptional repressor for nem operon